MADLFAGYPWGRNFPEGILDKVKVTWGARAIYTDRIIDLVWNRQSWLIPGVEAKDGEYTPEQMQTINRLAEWVDTKGLPYLREQAKALGEDENRVVQLDDGNFHIEASPQSSYGYLYIRAWEQK